MNKYKNLGYLKNEILGQSRHHFIYGYNNEERKSFLEELNREFPIKIDSTSPMAVYVDEIGLPRITDSDSELDTNKIDRLSQEYLSFSIAYNILLKSKENVDVDLLNSRIQKLLNTINKYSKNSEYPDITNLEDLISVLIESKEFYKTYYENYLNNRKLKSIDEIVLPFLHLESFVSEYKKALNNNSHFGIIIDKKDDIILSSTKAINLLVGSRINRDISMKVVVEPGKWDCYIDYNGQYIEAIHDYGIIEFDNSHTEYVEKVKKLSR